MTGVSAEALCGFGSSRHASATSKVGKRYLDDVHLVMDIIILRHQAPTY